MAFVVAQSTSHDTTKMTDSFQQHQQQQEPSPHLSLPLPHLPRVVLKVPLDASSPLTSCNKNSLCWYLRTDNSMWWPALYFPNVREAHKTWIRCFDLDTQKQAIKAWTLQVLEEHLKDAQVEATTTPVLALLHSETRVELFPLSTTTTTTVPPPQEGSFMQEFSDKTFCTRQALKQQEQTQPNALTAETTRDWWSVMKVVQNLFTAPSPPPQAPPRVSLGPTTTTDNGHDDNNRSNNHTQHPNVNDTDRSVAAVSTATTTHYRNHGNHNHSQTPVLDDTQQQQKTALRAAVQPAAPNPSPLPHQGQLFPEEETTPQQQGQEQKKRTLQEKSNNNPPDSSGVDEPGNVNTDPEWTPPCDAEFPVRGAWEDVWNVLSFSGWSKQLRSSNGGAVKYFYAKPDCQTADSEPGIGYFTNLYDVQQFCRDFYHWQGPSEQALYQPESENDDDDDEDESNDDDEEESSESEEEENQVEEIHQRSNDTVISGLTNPTHMSGSWGTPPDHFKTRPQDPAKPLVQSPATSAVSNASSLDSSVVVTDTYLRAKGWNFKKGSGLVSWYYIRPGRSFKGGVEGVDYFTDWKAVEEYVKGTPKRSKKKKTNAKKSTKTVAKKGQPKPSKATKKTTVGKAGTTAVSAKASTFASEAPSKAPTRVNKSRRNNKNQRKRKERGPKHLLVGQVKRHLRNMGFVDRGAQWEMEANKKIFTFSSLTGLRKFLCQQGIPQEYKEKMEEVLTEEQEKQFYQWVRFANVPLVAREIEAMLKDFEIPKNLQYMFADDPAIQCSNNRFFIPGADNCKGRNRELGKHCFVQDREGLQDFRTALRGVPVWSEVTSRAEKKKQDRLKLHLWAATCDKALPKFDQKSAEDAIETFESMIELEHNSDDADVVEAVVEEPSDQDESLSFVSSDASNASTTASTQAASIKSRPKKKQKPLQWYETKRPLTDDVWPILSKLGCQEVGPDCFTHPGYPPETSFSIDQLRIAIAFVGLPSYEPKTIIYNQRSRAQRGRTTSQKNGQPVSLTPDERAILLQWVNFTHFPDRITPNIRADLDRLADPVHEKEICEKTCAAGFQQKRPHFYPPGSDQHKREYAEKKQMMCAERFRGFHELEGSTELSEFLRSAPRLHLTEPTCKDEDAAIFLRLWAIRRATKEGANMDLPRFSMDWPRWDWMLSCFNSSEDSRVTDVSDEEASSA